MYVIILSPEGVHGPTCRIWSEASALKIRTVATQADRNINFGILNEHGVPPASPVRVTIVTFHEVASGSIFVWRLECVVMAGVGLLLVSVGLHDFSCKG